MTAAIRTQRVARCRGCGLPLVFCLCAALPRLRVSTRLVVVMHRREPGKSSNSARLAVRMLHGAQMTVVGARDHVPSPDLLPAGPKLLLYPSENAPELSSAHGAAGPAVLIVPDGTWSQARRLMKRLARSDETTMVRLPAGPPSFYSLRRNERPGTVSTFEAIARALGVLEGEAIEQAMLPWLAEFVRRMLLVRGRRGEPAAAEV